MREQVTDILRLIALLTELAKGIRCAKTALAGRRGEARDVLFAVARSRERVVRGGRGPPMLSGSTLRGS